MDGQALAAIKIYGVVVRRQCAQLHHNFLHFKCSMKGKEDHVFSN